MNYNCWTLLAAVAVAIAVNHGAQAADNSAMQQFKKTLNSAEQSLLKRHMSKSPYIQGLLKRSKGTDKRDQIPAGGALAKRTEGAAELPACCSCSGGSEGCFHPSDVKRSRIIRCCTPGPVSKREQVSAQEAIADASPADQQLLEKHKSKIQYLVAAAQHPEGADENSKRSNIEGERDITKRLMTDINLAKKYGIKLEDLLASIKRRSMATNKKSQQ